MPGSFTRQDVFFIFFLLLHLTKTRIGAFKLTRGVWVNGSLSHVANWSHWFRRHLLPVVHSGWRHISWIGQSSRRLLPKWQLGFLQSAGGFGPHHRLPREEETLFCWGPVMNNMETLSLCLVWQSKLVVYPSIGQSTPSVQHLIDYHGILCRHLLSPVDSPHLNL